MIGENRRTEKKKEISLRVFSVFVSLLGCQETPRGECRFFSAKSFGVVARRFEECPKMLCAAHCARRNDI